MAASIAMSQTLKVTSLDAAPLQNAARRPEPASVSFTARPVPRASAMSTRAATTMNLPPTEDANAVTPPPTPVFPSSQAMANFLRAYSQMLQHVSSQTAFSSRVHETNAVSGDALASVGQTLLERLHIGLLALMGHPVHGVKGGTRWMRQEEELEMCLNELEADVKAMEAVHEKVPSTSLLYLTAMHCNHAAKLVSRL